MFKNILISLLISVNSFQLPFIHNSLITTSELGLSYIAVKNININNKNFNITLNTNLTRKLVHITSAPLFISSLPLYNEYHPNLIASIVPFTATIYIFQNSNKFTSILSRNNNSSDILKGPLIYTIILSLITLTNWIDKPHGIIAMTQLAIGDGFSDIIGRIYGKDKWPHNNNKSIQGSFAFFISAFISTNLILNYIQLYSYNYEYSQFDLLVISFLCSLIETIPNIDDNISVPLTALILSNYFL